MGPPGVRSPGDPRTHAENGPRTSPEDAGERSLPRGSTDLPATKEANVTREPRVSGGSTAPPSLPAPRPPADEFCRRLFRDNPIGMFRCSMSGTIAETNRALARMSGRERPGQLEGLRLQTLFATPRGEALGPTHELVSSPGGVRHELLLRQPDGEPRFVLLSLIRVEGDSPGGDVLGGTVVDITDRRRVERELAGLAYRDSLTGLVNRTFLTLQVRKALSLAERRSHRVAIVYVDLRRFKSVNDSLGHATGDRVLVEVARRMEGAVRDSDTLGRVGGDEFLLLMPEVEDREAATAAARRMADALRRPFEIGELRFQLSASFGMALFPDHGRELDDLMRAADSAMYRMKGEDEQRGIATAETDGDVALARDRSLETQLYRALDEGELTLHYQPVFRVDSAELEGLEGLLRWQHPEHGLLTAAEFLPSLDDPTLAGRVDEWALERAVGDFERWLPDRPPAWISVNLSSSTVRDPSLPDRLRRLLHGAGIVRSDGRRPRLVVEISERCAVLNVDAVMNAVSGLREAGVGMALDHFGTGHASLAFLDVLPMDFLKIDRSFVSDVEREPGRERLTSAIIDLGRALGARTVVEGIERASQLEWLVNERADLVQGFFAGEPAPLRALA